jgi:F0F1-type ATP synthase assembly protein I
MFHSSARTEPAVSTDPESAGAQSPPADASSGDEGNRDTKARVMALATGVLVGTIIGVVIGMGMGNATRKLFDRWAPSY